MSKILSTTPMIKLVLLLKQLLTGIGLHLERWPTNALSAETLSDLIVRVETTQTELAQAEEAVRVARESLEGSLRQEVLENYRMGRDLAKAVFKSKLEDFGLKPRAERGTSNRIPRAPNELRLVRRTEKTAFVDWKAQTGRPVYEVFYSVDTAEAEGVFAASSTSSSLLLEGLLPGHTYYVRVRARLANRQGPLSKPTAVVMPPIAKAV